MCGFVPNELRRGGKCDNRSGSVRIPQQSRFQFEGELDRISHYLFRYPAKFHPPIARTLLAKYTRVGDVVLDPFCGSGTLLVEASVLGRSSIGIDVDPVAAAVARAKIHRFQLPRLRESVACLLRALDRYKRDQKEYELRKFVDLSLSRYESQVAKVRKQVPAITSLFHWFRRYVVVDLARIRHTIEHSAIPESHRDLFRIVFASIIRNSSNADPVPVSGLEVTALMKKRDADGRIVDPFLLFERALKRALTGCETFNDKAGADVSSKIFCADATELDRCLSEKVQAVITSPPGLPAARSRS